MDQGPKPPHNYVQYDIPNAYTNRKLIIKHGKGKPGVYVFKDLVTGAMYVGSAVNLYSRTTSYFMRSIITSEKRRVYRYFDSYGYDNVYLTLFVMSANTQTTERIALEQHFIDLLEPDLNVDLIAGGMSGYHTPMSETEKNRLRKERGTAFLLYDVTIKGLIFEFDAKQQAYDNINIHHDTLNEHLNSGKLYLNRFIFSTTPVVDYPLDTLLPLKEVSSLVNEVRNTYVSKQPAAKPIYAENVNKPELSKMYGGISEFARAVKGDRTEIRKYVNGLKPTDALYRKQ